VNDANVRDIFIGKDNKDKVSSNYNQKLYTIVNNIPTEPLRMIENFPVAYIEWGTFSEIIPRNNPPQKSFSLSINLIVFWILILGLISVQNIAT
jgi:hypothetical protein